MKKLKITSLLMMLGMLNFLTACEQKTETPTPIPTPPTSVPMTPAQEMVANFAPQLGKTAADISKTNFEERVNFEGLSARKIEETLNLGWKLLSILPRTELKRIKDEYLDQYYGKVNE